MTKNRSVGVHDCLFRTTFHRAAAKQVYDYEVKGGVVCELFRAQTLGDLRHLFSNAVEHRFPTAGRENWVFAFYGLDFTG